MAGSCVCGNEHPVSLQHGGISGLAEILSVSQGLCSMQLVILISLH